MTTGTRGWHADPALLSSYLAGDLDAVTGASVEQHVSRCETCRAAVGQLLEPQLLEETWIGIRDAVHELGLDVRAGLHLGEIEVLPDDIAGLAVHIGARVSALAGAPSRERPR